MKIAHRAAAFCLLLSLTFLCIGCGDGQTRAVDASPDPGMDAAGGSKLPATTTKK